MPGVQIFFAMIFAVSGLTLPAALADTRVAHLVRSKDNDVKCPATMKVSFQDAADSSFVVDPYGTGKKSHTIRELGTCETWTGHAQEITEEMGCRLKADKESAKATLYHIGSDKVGKSQRRESGAVAQVEYTVTILSPNEALLLVKHEAPASGLNDEYACRYKARPTGNTKEKKDAVSEADEPKKVPTAAHAPDEKKSAAGDTSQRVE